jgi:nicotinate-nucleotide pyrophosphorylase (carboxylating)
MEGLRKKSNQSLAGFFSACFLTFALTFIQMYTNPALPYLTSESLFHFIDEAFREDIGPGDFSSLAVVPSDFKFKAELKVKASGILAGVEMAKAVFHRLDPDLRFQPFLEDGALIEPGQVAFWVEGKGQSILSGERLALNCMQRMSGIATLTRQMVDRISHTKARLLDTRKTTPNARLMEKWAVAIGGGQNHRFGLFDMIMLKDNHVDYCGGIEKALKEARAFIDQKQLDIKIEIETRNLEEFQQALDTGLADVIMVDNFSLDSTRKAVQLANGRVPIEASGNIRMETLVDVAETGVDFISVGALTHSYRSLDLSLKAIKSV